VIVKLFYYSNEINIEHLLIFLIEVLRFPKVIKIGKIESPYAVSHYAKKLL
jgi:hypothetical protein